LQSFVPVFSNKTGTLQSVSFGAGWVTKAGPGEFINVLPEFAVPAYSGAGPIQISCEIAAGIFDMSNYAIWLSTVGISYISGADIQFDTTDFTKEGFATGDLSLVGPPSGQSGCGIKTTGGGTFWCGISGAIAIPDGVTFP
jgi:hypothetical protein